MCLEITFSGHMLESERIFTCDNVKFKREAKTKQPFRRLEESGVKEGGNCSTSVAQSFHPHWWSHYLRAISLNGHELDQWTFS